ncbi:MAG: type III-B CRISPR module RAMP protein Cmr1 [Nitrospinae bacterium]|nr:type III-B CRISPR module RAMP protein Cmr1 [Nitrospinota bacterium]
MLKRITFEIETITPMFLAGANQGTAELRAASIKGLLRFWWRALQSESDIEKLRNRESQIFGSSDEKMGGGSSFSVRVITNGGLKPTKNKFPPNPQYQVPVEGKTFEINILEYLAYGTYEYVQRQGNVFTREYYPAKTKFDIVLNFTNETWKNEVLKAFYVWCIFGGVGSRSKNGFGSLNVVNTDKAFEDIKDIFSVKNPYEQENLKKLIKNNVIVSYPSFTQGTKLFKAKQSFGSGFDVLADVGKIYKNGRGRLERRHCFDKRQYIGSPIVEKKVTKSFLDRHAKPHFIKIAKEGNKYRAYILYLPSRYCDGLEKDRNNRSINHSNEDREFTKVCTEFNGFLADNMETVI